MSNAVLGVGRSYLILGAAVAVGAYAVHSNDTRPTATTQASIADEPRAARVRATAQPSLPREEQDDADENEATEQPDEEIRGHAAIESSDEFALVFSVGPTSYLRLSAEQRATSRGRRRMHVEDGVHSVIASVATSALPHALQVWSGRDVLVNGTCRARVVGFAEVSRVSGQPPGSEDYDYASEDERGDEPQWTIDNVADDNVMLAAVLDGCSGSWARTADYAPAVVAHAAESPGLETAAIADLMARDTDDPIQAGWARDGGEGDWRDAVDVDVLTYEHPLTGEHWVFASAHRDGGCGDASVALMAAYRAGAHGKLRRVADLEFAGESIAHVVDLDGDGQPELVLGDGDRAELVDLANNRHDSIDVPEHHYGCGC